MKISSVDQQRAGPHLGNPCLRGEVPAADDFLTADQRTVFENYIGNDQESPEVFPYKIAYKRTLKVPFDPHASGFGFPSQAGPGAEVFHKNWHTGNPFLRFRFGAPWSLKFFSVPFSILK